MAVCCKLTIQTLQCIDKVFSKLETPFDSLTFLEKFKFAKINTHCDQCGIAEKKFYLFILINGQKVINAERFQVTTQEKFIKRLYGDYQPRTHTALRLPQMRDGQVILKKGFYFLVFHDVKKNCKITPVDCIV